MLANASDEESFVASCEADYTKAEITALAHMAPGTRSTTLLLAVVELLHEHLESNPVIGLSSEDGGYPRRINLPRGGTLLVQRWHVPVSDGINWYRACSRGSIEVPGKDPSKPTAVSFSPLGEDPPWPHLVVELEKFWRFTELWGDRPGGSRWHRLVPLAPVDFTTGWDKADFDKAREFFLSEIHVDLLSRSVLLGSCHLRLPNPIYRDLRPRVRRDRKGVTFDLELHPGRSVDDLEVTVWNQRSWGATSVRRMTLQPGVNELSVPEGVEQLAHAVYCGKRGLLEQVAGPYVFPRAIDSSVSLVAEHRHVETPKGEYTVGVSGEPKRMEVGSPRPAGALARLAADEMHQRTTRTWEQSGFRWFDKDAIGGTQEIRDIIQSASKQVDLLDPYFGSDDLLEFSLATTWHGLPFRVLTSAVFCKGKPSSNPAPANALVEEQGAALAKTLASVREKDPRLNIEIKVMPGEKSPVHDRFLIVDGTVWVLGASLNEFGSRGTLLMKLPAAPIGASEDSPEFSVSKSVFDAHWKNKDALPLKDWVKKRANARKQTP